VLNGVLVIGFVQYGDQSRIFECTSTLFALSPTGVPMKRELTERLLSICISLSIGSNFKINISMGISIGIGISISKRNY
jgi:hypothetical protein